VLACEYRFGNLTAGRTLAAHSGYIRSEEASAGRSSAGVRQEFGTSAVALNETVPSELGVSSTIDLLVQQWRYQGRFHVMSCNVRAKPVLRGLAVWYEPIYTDCY